MPTPEAMDPAEIYRDLGPNVLGYLRAQGAADPEDLLGETFLQVARDAHRFRGDGPEDVRRWVFTIARNRLVDDRRRAARRPATLSGVRMPERPLPDRSEPPDPVLVAALAELTPEQREVVALRFVADLSLADVARMTGRKPNAVKQLQHRALESLRQKIGARQ